MANNNQNNMTNNGPGSPFQQLLRRLGPVELQELRNDTLSFETFFVTRARQLRLMAQGDGGAGRNSAHFNKANLIEYLHNTNGNNNICMYRRELVKTIFPSYFALPKQALAVIVGIASHTPTEEERAPGTMWRVNPIMDTVCQLQDFRRDVEEGRGHMTGANAWANLQYQAHPLHERWWSYYVEAFDKLASNLWSNNGPNGTSEQMQIQLIMASASDAVRNEQRTRRWRQHDLELEERRVRENPDLTQLQKDDIQNKVIKEVKEDPPTCYLCLDEISSVGVTPFSCNHPICVPCSKTIRTMREAATPQCRDKRVMKGCGTCRNDHADYVKKHFSVFMNDYEPS